MATDRNIRLVCGVLIFGMLVGCNTVKGFGQDLSAGGKALTSAASDGKNSAKASAPEPSSQK